MFVLGFETHDRFPVAALAPEPLGGASRVVGDDGVGSIQNLVGRAVVLIEHDDPRIWIVLLEVVDVANVRSSPAIDALVAIAHHAQISMLRREPPNQDVLGAVRVLVLVDEDVAKPLLVLGQHVGESPKQLDRDHQEIVEVHRRRFEQPLLIEPVHVGHLLVIEAFV